MEPASIDLIPSVALTSIYDSSFIISKIFTAASLALVGEGIYDALIPAAWADMNKSATLMKPSARSN